MLRKKLYRLLPCLVLAVMLCALMPSTASAANTWDGTSSSTDWTGSGTSVAPYVISTAAQLRGFADNVNSGIAYSGVFFKLGDDINLADYAWAPIGGACPISTSGVPTGNYFAGVFDGDNHTISGINISNPNPGYGAYALFGYVNGGTIANLSVAGSLNMGTESIDEIGSVVGYTNGSLYNLHSSMTVYVNDASYSASQAGGIAGVVENTDSSSTVYVRYCSNTGDVTARGRVGGIVGAVYCVSNGGVVIDQCYNTGHITSTLSYTKIWSGGVVGYCRGYITNCYNQGDLTTTNGHYIAGITGILQGANPTASMSNCYSTAVFHDYDPGYDRWLWGSADRCPEVHITNCFWLPDESNPDITQPNEDDSWGTQTYVSSITPSELEGLTEMTESNRSGTFSGYVVDNYLGALDLANPNGTYGFGYAESGGYPVLGWQLIPNFIVDLNDLSSPVMYYTVSASVNGGHGTAAAEPTIVSDNGSSTITISPDGGYSLATITDNGVDVLDLVSNNTYIINNITTNHTVIVTFTNFTYTLTYTAGAHGSIIGSSPQTVPAGGSGSEVTAVADGGYHFAGWSDGSADNPRTDTNVTADISVRAVFIIDNPGGSQPDDHFTIAVIPDTQYYSESSPDIFDQQTQWIADNAQSENIVFVTHLGDLVNVYNDSAQWQNARDSMSIIRAADIPYSVVPGNHDLNNTFGDPTYFDAYFPYDDFTGYSWYGGHYPSTSNTSNYELFSARGQDFIVLNLICTPSLLSDATTWANDILTQNSDRKAIVITHGYIDTSGNYLDAPSVSGIDVWNNIVQYHSNVIMVLCGHYSGQYYGTDTGVSGNTIYNLLTDYQDEANGGNGWLRLYEFYPELNKVTAITYSPYLDQYDTTTYAHFDFFLDMSSTGSVSMSGSTALSGEVAEGYVSISVPGSLEIDLERGASNYVGSTVEIDSNMPWQLNVEDEKTDNRGHMVSTLGDFLANPMIVNHGATEVDLSTDGGGTLATGAGPQSVAVGFNQESEYSDAPGSYEITVTFTVFGSF